MQTPTVCPDATSEPQTTVPHWNYLRFAQRIKMRIIFTFFVLPLLLCGLAEPAQEKGWLSYQPAVVELKGTLSLRRYYGPPNYGENPKNDTKETMFILILSQPVNVRGNPDPKAGFDRQSVKNIRRIQLVLTIPYKGLIGKRVIVKGTLFHAFTAHHHTDVLMDVRSIEELSHK